MRRFFVVIALFIALGAIFASGRSSYDRGFSRGFESGAIEAAEAVDQAADGGTVQVITAPDRDRFGPGFPGGLIFLAFPLLFLLAIGIGGRGMRRGGCGPGAHAGSPWGDPERRMQDWHERVHAGGPTGADVESTASSGGPSGEPTWPKDA